MPGYILHLTEAELILGELKKRGVQLNETWINQFRLGSLLPDTKRKTEKITSHFWNPKSLIRLAIPPDMQLFDEKYGASLQGALMLGYRAHLELDTRYVEQFWDEILEFWDEQGQQAVLKKEIKKVWLKVFEKEVAVDDFFSSGYYYGDYSRMNRFLLNKYDLTVPHYESGLPCPITEVNVEELKEVLNELHMLCIQPPAEGQEELKVFCMKDLERFIQESAEAAVEWIMQQI